MKLYKSKDGRVWREEETHPLRSDTLAVCAEVVRGKLRQVALFSRADLTPVPKQAPRCTSCGKAIEAYALTGGEGQYHICAPHKVGA